MGPIQWGSVGEWAGAVGTSAAVIITAITIRRERQDRLEQEALRVVPSSGPVGAPTAGGQPGTAMLVTVNNAGTRTVTDVHVTVALPNGTVVYDEPWSEIPPLSLISINREPTEPEWAPAPGAKVFEVLVTATFIDGDGRKWLRDSDGHIHRLRR